jgi:hypothetical protein
MYWSKGGSQNGAWWHSNENKKCDEEKSEKAANQSLLNLFPPFTGKQTQYTCKQAVLSLFVVLFGLIREILKTLP